MAQNLPSDEPFLASLDLAKERLRSIFDNRGLSYTETRITRIANEVMSGERGFVDVRIALQPYAKENADVGIPERDTGGDDGGGPNDAAYMGSLADIKTRVRAIFRNRGLEDDLDATRLNRIANEIESGSRTFDSLRADLEPFAKKGGGSAVSAEVRKYLEEYFPSFVWAVDDPELGKILAKAADEEWSPTRIQAALEGTSWWQKTSRTAREARLMRENDPAEWSRNVNARIEEIVDQTTALGLSMPRSRARRLATESLTMGFTPQQLRSAIIAESNLDKIKARQITRGAIGGELSVLERQVEERAYQWMLGMTGADKLGWAKQILRGEKTLESFESYAQAMARKNMPFIADLIDQGLTPEEALSPYRQQIAQQLEIAPSAVDFMDGRYQAVLQKGDGSQLVTIPELKANVREKFADEWNKTSNAKQAAATMTEQLGRIFGRTA